MSPLAAPSAPLAAQAIHSRRHPFLAELIRHDRLSGPGSTKDTRHFALNLKGSGLSYSPGDSLGAFGQNSPQLVDELLRLLDFDPQAPLNTPQGETSYLRETLLRDYTVNRANRKIVSALAQRIPQGEARNRLMEILDNSDELAAYIDSRDYVDILKEFPEARFESPEAFVAQLTPIAPRLYSIASSPDLYPGEVHLCVTVVRYDTHSRPKKGLASGFLADHAGMFMRSIPIYIQESRTFRLPQDRTADIIMIGPGTGLAPFRAFLQHRLLEGAAGRNWLFFGEQRQACDFLYREELLGYRESGHLHRLDLAFSRDQDHKIYVQHRLREQGREVWAWLRNGAYVYVCGDAKCMAKDVHQALIDIAHEQGGLSLEAAADYVNTTLMRTEKRYLRDVY